MNGAEAIRAILERSERIAEKWRRLRDENAFAAWDDFSFYKGNGRFAAGAHSDLAALAERTFLTRAEACDAAARLVRERSWDSDYDEPTAVRSELLEAIETVWRER